MTESDHNLKSPFQRHSTILQVLLVAYGGLSRSVNKDAHIIIIIIF